MSRFTPYVPKSRDWRQMRSNSNFVQPEQPSANFVQPAQLSVNPYPAFHPLRQEGYSSNTYTDFASPPTAMPNTTGQQWPPSSYTYSQHYHSQSYQPTNYDFTTNENLGSYQAVSFGEYPSTSDPVKKYPSRRGGRGRNKPRNDVGPRRYPKPKPMLIPKPVKIEPASKSELKSLREKLEKQEVKLDTIAIADDLLNQAREFTKIEPPANCTQHKKIWAACVSKIEQLSKAIENLRSNPSLESMETIEIGPQQPKLVNEKKGRYPSLKTCNDTREKLANLEIRVDNIRTCKFILRCAKLKTATEPPADREDVHKAWEECLQEIEKFETRINEVKPTSSTEVADQESTNEPPVKVEPATKNELKTLRDKLEKQEVKADTLEAAEELVKQAQELTKIEPPASCPHRKKIWTACISKIVRLSKAIEDFRANPNPAPVESQAPEPPKVIKKKREYYPSSKMSNDFREKLANHEVRVDNIQACENLLRHAKAKTKTEPPADKEEVHKAWSECIQEIEKFEARINEIKSTVSTEVLDQESAKMNKVKEMIPSQRHVKKLYKSLFKVVCAENIEECEQLVEQGKKLLDIPNDVFAKDIEPLIHPAFARLWRSCQYKLEKFEKSIQEFKNPQSTTESVSLPKTPPVEEKTNDELVIDESKADEVQVTNLAHDNGAQATNDKIDQGMKEEKWIVYEEKEPGDEPQPTEDDQPKPSVHQDQESKDGQQPIEDYQPMEKKRRLSDPEAKESVERPICNQ